MFTYLYTFKFYRFLKSGMLLDFFIKRFIYFILVFLFYIFNIKFSEKYFIEYNFLRVNRIFNYIKLILDYFSMQFIINTLVVIIGFSVIVCIIFVF